MYNNKVGWYRLLNPEKFIPPIDNHMKSFNESNGSIQYKSSLELRLFRYCDYNKHLKKFSIEPFAIKYISPKDGKEHRYYVDAYMEFNDKDKFLVEVKSFGETKPPRTPKRKTEKAKFNYMNALLTYSINTAKWKAAKEVACANNMRFIILTEKELK